MPLFRAATAQLSAPSGRSGGRDGQPGWSPWSRDLGGKEEKTPDPHTEAAARLSVSLLRPAWDRRRRLHERGGKRGFAPVTECIAPVPNCQSMAATRAMRAVSDGSSRDWTRFIPSKYRFWITTHMKSRSLCRHVVMIRPAAGISFQLFRGIRETALMNGTTLPGRGEFGLATPYRCQ